MMTCSKYHQDFEFADKSITKVIGWLVKELPIEMVALVLLKISRYLLDEFTEIEQWELVNGDLLDIHGEFDINIAPHLSNLIDYDVDAENYDKRYA